MIGRDPGMRGGKVAGIAVVGMEHKLYAAQVI